MEILHADDDRGSDLAAWIPGSVLGVSKHGSARAGDVAGPERASYVHAAGTVAARVLARFCRLRREGGTGPDAHVASRRPQPGALSRVCGPVGSEDFSSSVRHPKALVA